MAEQNVVVVRFTELSNAHQALSVLKECDASGRIGLESAAVVQRTAEGELRIAESTDSFGLGAAGGSLIGILVGVLGGPLGLLLGWGAGAMMGMAFDIDQVETADEALVVLGRAIPPESTAVIASVKEPAVEVIDGEMKKLDGEVTRRPVAEVMDELEVAEAAADAAAREARRALHEKRKAELTAGVDERVGKLKEKLHRLLTTRAACRRLWEHEPLVGSTTSNGQNGEDAPYRRRAEGDLPGWLEEIHAERAGSDDELERRGEVDRLAIHSGVDRPGGGQLESHGGPGPSRLRPARGVSRTTTPSCPLSSDGRVPGACGGSSE